MSAFTLQPSHQIETEEDLRKLYGPMHALSGKKCIDRLDRNAVEFISRSPFLCIGTQNPDGPADVSPRGDPPGFVKVLDDKTIAIPDRPGNNRLDTIGNLLANPSVGLLFMVPGFDDTLRVNGKAILTTDPDLLASMAVKGRNPTLAIVVNIHEVFMHCAKAFRRSKLWDPASLQDRGEMPSLASIILEQVNQLPDDKSEMEKIDQEIEEEYKQTMY